MRARPAFPVLVFFVIFFPFLVFAQTASQEQLTITTYYPSPNGSYDQLGTNKLVVDVGQAQTEFSNSNFMQNGDAHIGRSLIIGQEVTGSPMNSWSYRHLFAAGLLPQDGDLRMKGNLLVGADRLNYESKVYIKSTSNSSANQAIDILNSDGRILLRLSDDGSMGINGLPENIGEITIHGDATNNRPGSLLVRTLADDHMFFVGINGHVGIGTITPPTILSIQGGHIWEEDSVANRAFVMYKTDSSLQASKFYFRKGNPSDPDLGKIGHEGTDLMVIDNDGNVGINVQNASTTTLQYALTVNGTAWCTSGIWSPSDLRWKKNIEPIKESISKLLKLRGIEYEWKRDEFKQYKFPSGKQIGIIAQEMEKEFPELVNTDNKGYKAIAYDRFSAVLLEAIKEQQAEIKNLRKEIEELKSKIK